MLERLTWIVADEDVRVARIDAGRVSDHLPRNRCNVILELRGPPDMHPKGALLVGRAAKVTLSLVADARARPMACLRVLRPLLWIVVAAPFIEKRLPKFVILDREHASIKLAVEGWRVARDQHSYPFAEKFQDAIHVREAHSRIGVEPHENVARGGVRYRGAEDVDFRPPRRESMRRVTNIRAVLHRGAAMSVAQHQWRVFARIELHDAQRRCGLGHHRGAPLAHAAHECEGRMRGNVRHHFAILLPHIGVQRVQALGAVARAPPQPLVVRADERFQRVPTDPRRIAQLRSLGCRRGGELFEGVENTVLPVRVAGCGEVQRRVDLVRSVGQQDARLVQLVGRHCRWRKLAAVAKLRAQDRIGQRCPLALRGVVTVRPSVILCTLPRTGVAAHVVRAVIVSAVGAAGRRFAP